MGGHTPTGPEGWAYHTGLLAKSLKAAGITDVQFINFPNGPDLNEALLSGALDVGLVGDTPAILAKAAGAPTRALNQSAVGTNAWLITKKNGPRTLAALAGQTVATAKGSYMSRYLLGLLQEEGLSKSVKFVHLLPTDAEPALSRGDIAAYAAPTGIGPLLVSHGYPILDQAILHKGLSGSGITVISASYLANHPGFPKVWNDTRAKSIDDLRAHSDAYYSFAAQASSLPIAIEKASYPLTVYAKEPFTKPGIELLTGTKAFLLQQHLAKADFKIADWEVTQTPAQ